MMATAATRPCGRECPLRRASRSERSISFRPRPCENSAFASKRPRSERSGENVDSPVGQNPRIFDKNWRAQLIARVFTQPGTIADICDAGRHHEYVNAATDFALAACTRTVHCPQALDVISASTPCQRGVCLRRRTINVIRRQYGDAIFGSSKPREAHNEK